MKRAILCTLIAAALLLSACTRASESTVRAPDAGAPLTLCLGAGPAALDPARTENGVGATYVVNLFAGLTGYRAGGDGKAELTPELCAALPEPESLPDGRVQYVFTLRDGLTWSDGTPLTAADFVYAWNRASTLSDAAAPYLFACIDGYGTGRLNVTASADGRTLTVVLAEAMPTFLQLCAQPAYAPVPSGAADTTSWTADGAAFVTSGPYTVAAWTTESLTYTKNPAYWDADNVAAETVRFVFQSDASAAASAFLAHEYALSWPVPDDALDDLRANHAPELRTVSQLGTYSLCFSMSDPALSAFSQTERAQIRTALALLIDRSYLCSEITPGAQQSANAPIPPGVSDADGSAFTAHNGADGKGGGYYGRSRGQLPAGHRAPAAGGGVVRPVHGQRAGRVRRLSGVDVPDVRRGRPRRHRGLSHGALRPLRYFARGHGAGHGHLPRQPRRRRLFDHALQLQRRCGRSHAVSLPLGERCGQQLRRPRPRRARGLCGLQHYARRPHARQLHLGRVV